MAAEPSPAEETADDRHRAGLHALVAEDNPVNRDIVRRMLERLGCRVSVVGDGLAAVEAVRRDHYGIVFMDVQMPGLDGLQATAAIRALPGPGGGVWIVALTANAFEEDVHRCRAAGMNDFLAKPVRLADLETCLARRPAPPPREA